MTDTAARDPFIDALVQSSYATMAVLTKVAAEHELSLTQLRMLAILRGRRLGITALAELLGLEKSTVSGLVDRAAARGLVARAPHPTDKRAVELELGGEGLRLAGTVTARVAEALAPMSEALDATERERLQELLERMLSSRA